MSDDARIELPEGWTETRFERGEFGPDDRPGFEARFELASAGGDDVSTDEPDHEPPDVGASSDDGASTNGPDDDASTDGTGDASLSVLPVRYRRSDGRERIEGLTEEYRAARDEPTATGPAPATTAFATRATFTPYERQRRSVVCVAADPGDALAVAAWLAAASDDARELGRNVELHSGTRPPSRSDPALPDDDVLASVFAEEPDRCVFTGKETRSHRIEVPYRYVPLLAGARETARGVPRFPSTVRTLVGAVSHAAWTDQGLEEVDVAAPLERLDPGAYRLDPAAADALAGADADRFALARLGDT